MRSILSALVFSAFAMNAVAEKKVPFRSYPLDEMRIERALDFGTRSKGSTTGLILKDTGQTWMSGLATGTKFNSAGTLSTGFSLQVYTPFTWIAQNASWEAKKYLELTADQVTGDMKRGILRVYANPDTARSISSEGMRGTSGVEHVVLRTTKKRFEVVQPLELLESAQYAQNAFGAKVGFASMEATFSMEDVQRISSVDKKGEFFIVVIGTTGEEKKFKVKTKHFDRIP